MRTELKRIHRTLGITTVFVTHDQAEALSTADSIVLMREGRIEQMATPDDLHRRPRTEFAARFFGHVNEVSGVVESVGGETAQVRTEGAAVVPARGLSAAPGATIRMGAKFTVPPQLDHSMARMEDAATG